MLKRIALFIIGHLAFFGVAAAIVAASTADAGAQTDNPYDLRFVAAADAPMRAGPETGDAQTGTLAAGTGDIRLRWCRPEFPFEQWMFGSARVQQQLLDERVCEVEADGRLGYVAGDALRVQ